MNERMIVNNANLDQTEIEVVADLFTGGNDAIKQIDKLCQIEPGRVMVRVYYIAIGKMYHQRTHNAIVLIEADFDGNLTACFRNHWS